MRIYYFLYLIIIFSSCSNNNNSSFAQLKHAFDIWYCNYNYCDDSAKETLDKFLIIDQYFVENYNNDIKRFSLELSQLNTSRLRENYLNEYHYIENLIKYSIHEINIIKEYENSLNYYLNVIIEKITFIRNSDMTYLDKMSSLIDVMNKSSQYLALSRNILKNSRENENISKISNEIIKIIKTIRNNSYDEEFNYEKFDIFFEEYKNTINDYGTWYKNNLDKTKNQTLINSFKEYMLISGYDINFMIEHYKKLSNDLFNKLFDSSLNIYLTDNDEPIWVDKTDSINVIQWVVNNKINKIDKVDKYDYEYVNHINNVNHKYFKDYSSEYSKINEEDVIIPLYSYESISIVEYLMIGLVDKIQERRMLNIFKSNEYNNAFILFYENLIKDEVFYGKDSLYDVLFYLNLYRQFTTNYLQMTYISTLDTLPQTTIKNKMFVTKNNSMKMIYENIYNFSLKDIKSILYFLRMNNNFYLKKNEIDKVLNNVIQ